MKILLLVTFLPFLLTVNANNENILQCRWNIFGDDIAALYINMEQSEMPRQEMIHRFCEKVNKYQECVAEEEREQVTVELMQGMCEYGFQAVYKNITCLSKVITELKSTCLPQRNNCASSDEWFQCSLMVTQHTCGEKLGYVMASLQQLYCQIFQVMTIETPQEDDSISYQDESELMEAYEDNVESVSNGAIKTAKQKTTIKPHSKPIKPKPTGKPSKPTKPHSTGKPSKPTKPHSTGKPSKPTQPKSTGKPSKPTKPHSTGKPSKPTKPKSTGKPSKPTKPHSTGKPSKPTQPKSTGKPSKPTKPHSTGKPSKPTKPKSTGKPSKPTKPHSTGKPSKPTKPHSTGKTSKPTKPHSTKKPIKTTKGPIKTTKKPVTTMRPKSTTNSANNHLSSSFCYIICVVAATYLTKIF